MRAAGLPERTRFHDLRHTCAALCIALGAHPKAIQERLGHSSITVTLDRYGHLFPKLDETLTTRLDEMRQAATTSRPVLSGPVESRSVPARTAGSRGLPADLTPRRRPPRRWPGALTSPSLVETMGLEPTTPCLQSRCSSQLSYVPEVG